MTKEEKALSKVKKKKATNYRTAKMMKRRIKNSVSLSNIKDVDDDGIINLKSGEVCSLIEVNAIDLSLASRQEKNNFYATLKSLYQIKGLNLKCYKIDDKINLNNNKEYLEKLIEYFNDDKAKQELLDENKSLIEYLESNDFTVSSI